MPVQHDVVHDVEQLLRYEEHYITLGYEGVMLRAPAGPYKYGRSTLREGYLLKLKRFEDAEAVVLGVEEEMQNTNEAVRQADGSSKRSTVKAGLVGKNVLGALIVRGFNGRYKGTAFRVGSGFTASERAALWADAQGLVGKVITYKFFNVGSDAAPRFPTFKGFRSPLDMA
jgi:DNA ligase-1